MEDIEISRRLKHLGRPACLREKVITSGPSWGERGALRTILLTETSAATDGENRSTTLSDGLLVRHVCEWVHHYLDAATIDLKRDEFDQLDQALCV